MRLPYPASGGREQTQPAALSVTHCTHSIQMRLPCGAPEPRLLDDPAQYVWMIFRKPPAWFDQRATDGDCNQIKIDRLTRCDVTEIDVAAAPRVDGRVKCARHQHGHRKRSGWASL